MRRSSGNTSVAGGFAQGILLAVLCLAAAAWAADEMAVQYHGAGWIQFGRVENSSDTLSNQNLAEYNFNKNWIQNTGGQITAVGKISANWEGGLGLGAVQVSNSRGSLAGAHTWSNGWNPFVTEARMTYSQPLGDKDKFQLTLGSFPYTYNPDTKNLGLYLTRGQVYPGTLISGFETKHIQPTAASQVGALARMQMGGLQNDLLLNSETETKPYFDFSLADIAGYQVTPWLQIGVGVNFYRLIPQNSRVTSPDVSCALDAEWSASNLADESDRCYIPDTVKADTGIVRDSLGNPQINAITGSMSGTKLMARFHFDPKLLFGWSGIGTRAFGKNDWVLYGEAALLGIKNYPKYYSDRWRRVPVMLGVNLPAFGLLDKFSIEVEYYGSLNYPDYEKAETNASWIPRAPGTGLDNSRNDWKWSLYASRALLGHLRIAGQVANDHLVIPGPPAASDPDWSEALTTPRDWYWMLKLAYFF